MPRPRPNGNEKLAGWFVGAAFMPPVQSSQQGNLPGNRLKGSPPLWGEALARYANSKLSTLTTRKKIPQLLPGQQTKPYKNGIV